MALQPIARWNVVPHADVTGNYFVGIAAFHKDGVTNCGLRLGTSGPPINISQMSLNPRTGVWEYCLPIPSSLIPDGNYVLQGFAIAPGGQQILPNVLLNIWQASATYTDKYVDADFGDDTTGDGLIGTPFQTIKKAAESFAGNGNGGRIYLKAATATYGLTAVPSVVPATTTRYLNIEAAPGAAKADVVIDTWATNGIGANKVRFRGVTIKTPIRAASADLATLWMEDCHLEGNGAIAAFPAAGWAAGWSARYFTAGEVTDAREGLNGWDLVSGATFERIGQKALQNCQAVIDVTIDVVDRLSDTTLIPAALSYNQNLTNALAYCVRAFDVVGLGVNIENPTGLTGLTQNMALVNLVFDNGPHGTWPSQVKDHQIEHLFIQNCTFAEGSFIFRTNALADLRVQQVCFRQVQTATGDILGQPILNPANFTDCHFIQGTSYGFGATTGSAGFTSAATDDYTPTAGSVLWTGHSAPKLVPADAEHVARDNPTTVGGLRGAAEGSGAGGVPPGNLVYTPVTTDGTTGAAIAPITPTWDGTITLFEKMPSALHLYKAPPEIVCDAGNAHYEVRDWAPGDPTDSTIASPGHFGWIVEDLRNGKKYLRNPKYGGDDQHDSLATAINLSAPFAADAGTYTHSLSGGPFAIANGPAERPIVRVRGTYLDGNPQGSSGIRFAPRVGYGGDGGGVGTAEIIGWSGVAGNGGFYPFFQTPAPVGKGKQIVVSIVGANLGNADKILGRIVLGPGFKTPSNTTDTTYTPLDVLFKNLTVASSGHGNPNEAFGTSKGERTGRLRLYDIEFSNEFVLTEATGGESGWGFKQVVHIGGGMHFDFRRVNYPPSQEHANYLHAVNAGILRDATAISGQTPDSWFIDCVCPNGTSRCVIQIVDRPYDHLQVGTIAGIPNPSYLSIPGGKGVVLIERCGTLKGSAGTDETWFTAVGGADITYIFRDNFIIQKGIVGQTLITKADGTQVPTTRHKRGIVVIGWAAGGPTGFTGVPGKEAQGIRINENGFAIRRVVIVDHFDDSDQPSEKRMSFRGCEEVHIYNFKHQFELGSHKGDIGLDEQDANPPNPWYNIPANEQFDLDGHLKYSVAGGFGPPISFNANNHPPNQPGNVYLYMGHPAAPFDYSGWLPTVVGSGPKLLAASWPSGAAATGQSEVQINNRAGTPVYLPAGLTLHPTTGVVSGTPTEGIGLNPLGDPIGTLITSPFAYNTATGHAIIPIKGSNSSSDDAWTPGLFQLGIIDTANQFITLPCIRVNARPVPPAQVAVDELIQLPKIRVNARTVPVFSIVDDGALTQVFAPPIRVNARMVPPGDVGNDQQILLPVIRVNCRVLGVGTLFGGIEKGDFAGEVLTGGCQDGEVIT